jgi:hypothetical protein
VIAVIAVVLVGVIGFGLGALTRDDDSDNAASPATPRTPAPSSAPTPTGPGASVLSQIVVRQADLPPTYGVALITNGNLVDGTVTLDLCNGTFASESLRTRRLQVVAADTQGDVPLSTEAVLYQSPDATRQAFAELASVAAKCPNTPVRSPSGGNTLTTKFDAPPDGAWAQVPNVDRVAYSFTTTDANGASAKSMAVYLKRGRALLGLYFPDPSLPIPPIAGQTTVQGIVNLFATRLAQLPESAVN